MESFNNFISQLPEYAGIGILMLSTFLIGYFYAWNAAKTKNRRLIERLKKQVNNLKSNKQINDIETIFTEIKPKIVAVVKQTQEELSEREHEHSISVPEKARMTFINNSSDKNKVTIEDDDHELDFDTFGYADTTNADDLTLISGIGPYIEKKLNEIGIYNFDQISNLKHKDIELVTELIEFFPGRIERDDWVGQAEGLKVL